MSRTRRFTVAIAALSLAVLTACGGAEGKDAGASTGSNAPANAGASAASGIPAVPAEAGHIHGMAVNPKDGLLYMGTHQGTMVLKDGRISRVGDATFDLMGFAGAGPDHFYSSGHPGPDDDLPNPVGLIESTDGGKTWKARSLVGQVDFHTLGASGDQLYGFSGQLVRSTGGKDWETGARIAPVSIAVDPGRTERLVVTTEQGPQISSDKGATFAVLEGAPLLYFVAWTKADALWGVAPDGTLHLSADAGATWTAKGKVGPPSAFAAGVDGSVVVASGTQVLRSTDGGMTFTPVATVAGGH